ncbi:hypothetical protein ACFE04_018266 [Oxalis oulophora]
MDTSNNLTDVSPVSNTDSTDNSMKKDADFTVLDNPKIADVASDDEDGFVSGGDDDDDEEEFELASDIPVDAGKAFVADFVKSPTVAGAGAVGIEGSGVENSIEESVESAENGVMESDKVEDVVKEKKSEGLALEQAVETEEAAGIVADKESEVPVDVKEQSSDVADAVVETINVDVTSSGVAVVGDVPESKDFVVLGDNFVDAVVDTINVDVTSSGVAVVGDVQESKDFVVQGDNFVDAASLPLENGFADAKNSLEVVEDLEALVQDAELAREIDSVALDYVEHAQVVPVEQNVDDSGEPSKDVPKGLVDNEDKVEEDKTDTKAEFEAKTIEIETEKAADSVAVLSDNKEDEQEGEKSQPVESNVENEVKLSEQANSFVSEEKPEVEVLEKSVEPESANTTIFSNEEHDVESESDEEPLIDEEGDVQIEGSGTDNDGETEDMIFENSEAAKQFLEELEQASARGSHSGAESSHDHSQRIDGQIVTDSEEEAESDEEGEGKELFDSAALAALLKAATGTNTDNGNITITSQDGSKLFSVERPAGLGSTLRAVRPAAARGGRPNLFTPSSLTTGGDVETNLSEEEKNKLEKLQAVRVKFLRLIHRLGCSPDDSVAAQVLYRLALVAGRKTSPLFSLDAAKNTALQLEEEGEDAFDFSLNILVIGKNGVGKSSTINSIFGEEMVQINTFEASTATVREISGIVDGVRIRVIDTPGLKPSGMEQGTNSKILSSVKKLTKNCPPDIVLYVDRLDMQARDLNDMPLLKTITTSLGSSIWRNAIVTLTHAASAPPDGPSGSPLSYEVFVAQRSHVVQQSIGQAVGDLRLMNPSLMNPVSLVENHPACRKNREGQKVLPNGQTWRPQLLLLCYSMKILSEASSLSKPQEPIDHRKLFGFRVRAPPLPYLLSWLLQSRTHPKLATDQGLENDSDVDLTDDLSDSDEEEEEDEYDQLPPFKPLRKVQLAKLSKEQRKAYFEEYDYRVKLLQKKQWKEELKRMKEMKKKGNVAENDFGYPGEDPDQESGAPAAVQVPLPDMALPPSFDSDNPAYRYRFLEPSSQFLARPVLDTHGWDHDCGYDGVNLEHNLAIAERFPTAVVVQVTKDKKEFNIHLDSSVSAKHGENGSSMAGFDIQNVGKQLAYIVRGETKFKNFKKNKTTAGVSVTFLGENVVTGLKIEDQIAIGKRLMLVGSTGTVRAQGDAAYGANLEIRLKEADFPIGQDQSSISLSLVKWRGDLALGANLQSQFSVGRASKIAVRAGLNNKLSGQVSVRTSTSDQFQIALFGIVPIVMAIYKTIRPPGVSEGYSMY